MAKCIWDELCDCPFNTPNGNPCSTHYLYNCSMFNGQFVSGLSQVNDGTTRIIEAIIAQIESQLPELDTHEQTLESMKSEAENKKRDIENMQRILGGNPTNDDEERAKIIGEEGKALLERLEGQMKDVDALIDAINESNMDRLGWVRNQLQIPYRGAGTCACYAYKKGQLDALATIISNNFTDIVTLLDQIVTLTGLAIAGALAAALSIPVAIGLLFFWSYSCSINCIDCRICCHVSWTCSSNS